MKRSRSYEATHCEPARANGLQIPHALWWLIALLMAMATTFALPIHQIRVAGALLNGAIGQYGTPSGGSTAVHVIWQKDLTVSPSVSAVTPAVGGAGGSSGSSVAGYCQIHFSYKLPPPPSTANSNGTSVYIYSNIKEFRIHKASDSDATKDYVVTKPSWNQDSSHAWRADCGDPDPSVSGSPPMQYFDTSWGTQNLQNDNYTITLMVTDTTYTYSSNGGISTPVDNSTSTGVSVQNILITDATPASGSAFVYNPAPTSPPTTSPGYTKSFDVTITGACKSLQPVTLTIYDANQNAVRTMYAGVPTNGVVIGGDSTGSSNVHLDWDGSLDSPSSYGSSYPQQGPPTPIMASPGVYSFQWRVGNLCAWGSNSYIGYKSSPGNYGSYQSDGDTDVSAFLSVSVPYTAARLDSDDGKTTKYRIAYIVSCTDGMAGCSGRIDIYDPSLSQVGQATVLAASDLTPGLHSVLVSYPSTAVVGAYDYTILAQDNEAGQDRGHRLRYAMRSSVNSKTDQEIASGTNYSTLCAVASIDGDMVGMTISAVDLDDPGHPTPTTIWQYKGPPSFVIADWPIIDTTHFLDGHHVLLSLIGKPASPSVKIPVPLISDRKIVLIYNKAYVLAYGPDVNSKDGIENTYMFIAANLNITAGHSVDVSTADNASVILSKLANNTFFYILTHGSNDGRFIDTVADVNTIGPVDEIHHVVHDTQVAAAITQKVSASGTLPPYNLVWIDGCKCGANMRFSSAFNVSGKDHAFVGWDVSIKATRRQRRFVQQAFVHLMNGAVLSDAMDLANFDIKSNHVNVRNEGGGWFTPTMYGDKSTKLHGVYGGNGTQWFR